MGFNRGDASVLVSGARQAPAGPQAPRLSGSQALRPPSSDFSLHIPYFDTGAGGKDGFFPNRFPLLRRANVVFTLKLQCRVRNQKERFLRYYASRSIDGACSGRMIIKVHRERSNFVSSRRIYSRIVPAVGRSGGVLFWKKWAKRPPAFLQRVAVAGGRINNEVQDGEQQGRRKKK
ncbi:hypothetical protein HCEG_07967 [Histoplasma capsulatum var. duboisii H88]|uniref:Uncharacterized protein n=1 Tax=Ajellomyces capsulatus (strain H88) TaxID=544711 RepID=F0US75_AJEC8|nr:hypothetical protein HCEG_07967 [Histoplasma capsulatum var. duboisii H88]